NCPLRKIILGDKAMATCALQPSLLHGNYGDISIVDKTGTFLLWYDTRHTIALTTTERST
ncbi:MAG: hypothetical protein ACRD2U_07940, partial [Terriglobales bacterium]